MTGGWVILDKSSGLFSRTAGGRVARMVGIKKFGHIGTLDPMASGVLAVAIGDATKMIPFIEDANPDIKEYLFSVVFGIETDTLDITGNIIKRVDVVPSANDIRDVLPKFIGDITQIPPAYSAVHVDGTRAYELARRGTAVDMPPRNVHIFDLEMTDFSGNTANFRVRCSRGTYVRSLGRDIAHAIGTIATVDMIRRTVSGAFDIKSALKLDFLENLFNNGGDISEYLMPIDYGLGDIPVCNLTDKDAKYFRVGGFIPITGVNGLCRVYDGDKFIGIGNVTDGCLRPKRTI
ncbi:tRNA pseudouridine(55) synthase TruB [bacterium]|nr:tRNA pseudouridine(55) synthase TruB [bacterium]